ncbi:hypothetical protein [Comamonas sp. NLF-1-9]|uniref:hypothetical protein n=1 Tax=Comamonas sp. NLF-1-9 TaxID=2853163 RepID=UPI001C473F85|nr:hypothetical protein [Comamonas sp. NLF-1-9]QXL83618.1 hypothetical protein KUD94_10190 [Comamonas sp. NLF-1-9]
MAHTASPAERAAQMQEIIANAQQALERSRHFYDDHGLDGEKARAFLESRVDEKARAEARRLFEQDMQEIDQEIHEQLAREASLNPGSGAPRRPRFMV